MTSVELILLVASIISYSSSFFAGGIFRRDRFAIWSLIAGLVFQLASTTVRWIGIGHPPVFGTYEAALAGSWFVLLYAALSYRSIHGHFRALVLTAVPISVMIIIYGLTFNTERIPLTISERSLWVDFHALFSWLAFAPFTLAFCLSGIYLWRSKRQSDKRGAFGVKNEIIDELTFRYINFGFINHTIMFALGCYYSSILYGTWWEWDPAESTSLITWLSVALYIHMRLFYNWKEKKAAWLFVVIFFTVIFSYWGLVYLPAGSTFHVFDLDLREH